MWRAWLPAAVAATVIGGLPVAAVASSAHPAPARPATVTRTVAPRIRGHERAAVLPHRSDAVRRDLAATKPAKVTRVLLILTYWTAKHPSITPAAAKKLVITEPNAWYRSASYGKQGLTGTATSWVRVAKPQECGAIDDPTFAAAERGAKRYHPGRYDRVILYQPCSTGGSIGLGEEPGNRVVLTEGGLTMPTAVHEQGHNYGLDHANQLSCTSGRKTATDRPGAHCDVAEYADFSSAMAAQWDPRYAGDFTAPQKAQLGWLTGHVRTVAKSGTVTLAPYETKPGVKAIKVPGPHHTTYWVEFRTRRGNDTHLPSPYIGVLIHQSSPSPYFPKYNASVQLDTVPPDVATSLFSQQTTPAYLPAHSSWTTPSGIRFTVDSQTSGSARITVQRGERTGVPGAVRGVTTRALDGEATLSFKPPANDGGYPVTSYVITASAGGAHRTVHAYESAGTVSATLRGLQNGTAYKFSVRAVNERGQGASTTSRATTPQKLFPIPTILSPSAGDSVSGIVPIQVEARHVAGGSPVTQMEVDVDDDGAIGTVDSGSRTTITWDTSGATLGSHTITLTAISANGRRKSTSVVVNLTQTSGPVLTVTSPSTTTGLTGSVEISGTVAPNPTSGRAVSSLEVDIDDSDIAFLDRPDSSWSTTWATDSTTPGRHTITVTATDRRGETSVVTETVTVAASEAISLTAPAANSTVHGLVHVTGTAVNNSSDSTLTLDITDTQGDAFDDQQVGAARGSSVNFDAPVDFDGYTGTLNLQVVLTSSSGQSVTAPLTLTVTSVPSTVAFSAPGPSVKTISGTTTFTAKVANNSGSDDPEITTSVDGDVVDDEFTDVPAGASGTYSLDIDTTGYANGPHTFTFTVTDANGSVAVSRTLTIAN